MGRRLKWAALFVVALSVHVIVALVVTGVPHPPAVTTEGVGRVPWGLLFEDVGRLWAARESKGLVSWMPDGSGVMVVAKRWLIDSRLHVQRAPGERERFLPQLPRGAVVHSRPGRPYLVFAQDTDGDEQYRLHRWDLGSRAPVPLTPAPERAVFGAFEPRGDRIAYVSNRRNGRDFDIYVMSVQRPATDRRLLEAEGLWSVAAWSPTSDELLVACVLSSLENELYVLGLRTGELTRMPSGPGAVRHGSAQWSRDGRALYYTSDRASEFGYLRRLDLQSGEERVLTRRIPWDVLSVQQSADGETLLIGVNEDGRTKHYTSDPLGEGLRAVDPFPSGITTLGLHPDEPVALVNHTDANGVTRGYVLDLATGELTLWAGNVATAGAAAEPRLVRFPTFDSEDGGPPSIAAFVYPGVGEGARPVLIDIHGGPEAQARLRVGQRAVQDAGITLITPNVRGSTGYGRTFTTLDDRYLREDAVRDIGALLDWIGRQPDLDESRVAVTGGSYGGYMVLASLVHHGSHIRCGVDVVGVSNFVTFLEGTAEYRRDLRRAEYGDERIPEMRAFLHSISPLSHAERIESPLMVVQGANDPRVPVGESRQLVDRVRHNGRDVRYIEAADEGHGFRRPLNALYAGLAQRALVRDCLLAN